MSETGRTPVQRIGRYAMYGEISSGGMATVYFGKLVGPVGFTRAVAIKRLHPHFAKNPEFVAMFLDEARLASRIRHPNVVPTLDVVHTDGELFLVMEYVQGEPLHRLIRRAIERGEKIPPRIVASVFAGMLHGLHAAHATKDERGAPLGIVHRDISPQNVLVGVDGVTRLLDFGVAKAAGRLQMTKEGHLKGKLSYMAPEQISDGTVNRLTDIYSAGVVLWEALCAQRLFEGDTEGQIIARIVKSEVEPPSRLVSTVSAALDAIVLSALARDPAKRFQTAREMAIALERSGEIAPASEVGEWVETMARDELAKRAAKLADMESETTSPPQSLRRPPKTLGDDATVVARARPAAHEPESPGVSPPTPPARPNTGRRRILVIDDSEVMLSRIQQALVTAGYDVVTTTRAVGNARHIAKCDLVIIDYHMPGIDGGTVISSLRGAATSASHPCLFYLYTSDPTIVKQFQQLGFDGAFTDKGNQETLVREVNALFRMMKLRSLRKS